jgi:IS30 family transposase
VVVATRGCRDDGGQVVVASFEDRAGRRQLSGKRQTFKELHERGWSIRGEAREVGVSRSPRTNWTSGVEVIRNGVQVGFVPPLDWSQVPQISARFLS